MVPDLCGIAHERVLACGPICATSCVYNHRFEVGDDASLSGILACALGLRPCPVFSLATEGIGGVRDFNIQRMVTRQAADRTCAGRDLANASASFR